MQIVPGAGAPEAAEEGVMTILAAEALESMQILTVPVPEDCFDAEVIVRSIDAF